jgi:hypothetical protein
MPDQSVETNEFIKFALKVTKTSNGEGKFNLKLTTNEGILINGLQELISNEFTVNVKLAITAKSVVEELSEAEIALITTSPQNIDANKLAIVKKAFDITLARATDAQIMAGLQIQKTDPDPLNQYILQLTVKPGYLINDNLNILQSNIFTVNVKLAITAKDSMEGIVTAAEMKKFTTTNSSIDLEKLTIIKKLFNIDDTLNTLVINGLMISKTTDELGKHTLLLTAKPGHIMNDSETVSSILFESKINFNITSIQSDLISVTAREILLITENITNIDLDILEIIKKAFVIPPIINVQDLLLGLKISKIALPTPNTYKLVLTINPGYIINDSLNELQSEEFTLEIINLSVTDKSILEEITPEEMINITGINQNIDETKFNIISKVFDIDPSIKEDVLKGLEIKRNGPESGNTYTLILTAKPGYTVNSIEFITSKEFTVIIDLLVTNKPSNEMTISGTEIDSISETYQDVTSDILDIMIKVFRFDMALSSDLIKGLQVKRVNLTTINTHQFVLKVKDGYNINGVLEFVSETIIDTIDLAISLKSEPEITILRQE